jgi:hypothetical protein
MTARELLDEILSQGPPSDVLPLECRLIFRQVADNLHQVRLRNGTALRDLSDVTEFFRELVAELAPRPANGRTRPALVQHLEQRPQWKTDPVCPECDHVHESRNECSKYLGEGKICHCEAKVTA